MDTPTCPPPRDDREKEILDRLVSIRDRLQLLKQDRTTYIRSQDVIPLYDETIEQVRQLNDIRSADRREENRVDRVLESCFQLLSLFFMTIGRNNEAPAAYALTSTIKRLLDHLTEVDLFSSKDLESISHTVKKLAHNVKSTENEYSPYIITLLSNRLELCEESLAKLRKRLDRLEDPLPKTYEKLISILRSMSLANTRTKFSASEVQKLQAQLRDIDEKRKEGKLFDADAKNGEAVIADGKLPAGSDEVFELLEKCIVWSDVVLDRKGVIPEPFKATYDILVRIRNELEKLSITQAWSLREADLFDFQRQLDKIDESRVDGNWLDDEGKPAELYVQRTLLYLIRRSYGYIYSLMISSEPVSEALLPIYNQLQTLKKCLIEVQKSGGVQSVRELYPYSMKLHSIDNMRQDGKFMINDDIPEGQGSVSELLADCFELNYELRVAAEEQAEA